MAKSKKSKSRPIDEEEPQIRDDEVTELAEDAEAEDVAPPKRPKTKSKTKAVEEEEPEVTELAEDAEDELPQKKSKSKTKAVEEEEPEIAEDAEATELAEDAEIDDVAPQKKTKMKGKTEAVAEEEEPEIADEDEATELAEDAEPEEAEELEPQRKTKVKAKTRHVADDDEAQVKDDDEDSVQLKDDEATALEEDAEEGDTELDVDDDESPPDKDDGDDDEDEEESIDEGPQPPRAKTPIFAIVLILLNWIMAPVFLTVAYLDHAKRTEFSYRTLVNYVQVWGLPLRCEEPGQKGYDPFHQETRPNMNLTTDQLRESFQKRPGANTKIIVKDKIDFAPFEETIVFDNNKLISAVRVPYRLRPSDMKTPGLLRDLGLIAKDGASQEEKSDPVYTLEDEIERLQKKLPDDIAKAAKDAAEALKGMKDNDKRVLVKKTFLPYSYDSVLEKEKTAEYDAVSGADLDALVKRAVIRKTLVNLAWNVKLVESLHDEAEKATGAKLDEMLDDALQRRMVYDLLAPINVFWPGDLGDFKKLKDFETLKDGDVKDKLLAEVIEKHKTERLADIVKQPMESVKALLDQRLKASISDTYDKEMHIGEHWPDGMKRTSVEKRRKISFILFALSQVSVPTLEKKLYDKGLERAQMVCGLYECTSAMVYYTRTQRVLQERYESAIKADRDGTLTLVKDGKFVAMPSLGGFPAEFEELINRLVTLKSRIDDADLRLKDLKEQRDKFQITHDERARQHRDALDRLLRARESTKKDLARLTELQDQLHDAHLQLSEAGKRNEELVREIEELTRRYVEEDRRLEALQKKGKKRP